MPSFTKPSVVACVGFMALAMATPAKAMVVNIDGLDFDLDQFIGAFVTTNVGTGAIFGADFDNVTGIDGNELGELSARPGGTHAPTDPGDRISLGIDNAIEDMLVLHYATPVPIGPGDASLFVVYESSGRTFVDPEGLNFRISVNGGAFVTASLGMASVVDVGGGAAEHNEIVFDLTDANFGFSIGDTISTVEIRNLTGSGGTFDPDFTFAARAGVVTASEPGSLAAFVAGGLALGGLAARRRR